MVTINPYLNFNGNTEEAFTFYKGIFGGQFTALQRFRDVHADGLPPDAADKLMHIALPVGNTVLMGTDTIESMGHKAQPGTAVSLSIDAADHQEANRLMERLSAGGTVSVPLEKMSWGAYFGMLTDPFGIQWMINCPAVEQ